MAGGLEVKVYYEVWVWNYEIKNQVSLSSASKRSSYWWVNGPSIVSDENGSSKKGLMKYDKMKERLPLYD
ncbi:uncharacterized protein EAE97_006600 [Botrytis byssoidea]|uniref:Uncharacterized protein n=1 Tax=Botrytis byssoidea TaxID=139641 RepID=A0A9P5M4X1_9HELO|nr:uncharacterized protein EAE97_006600 [Botrytis byssoidea]KAF7941763.1 hypothetical protein EAE97_006600 [Botrytis byssoidea]